MQFLVLGPVEVAADEQRSKVGSRTQRVILAVLLAARGEVVSGDRLIDVVWDGQPPPSARKSLQSHVSRLRRALAAAAPDGADVVATDQGGYRMALAPHALDATRFELMVARARREPDTDPQRQAHRLGEALALWRGPAFGELADLEPVRPEARRLEELRSVALGDRVDARLAAGDHQAVVGDLEATVAAEPLAERPHRQLMLALYRSGRQAAALAVHRQLQQRLVEELGVDPSPEVQELHGRIVRQDADLRAPTLPAPSRDDAITASPGPDRSPPPTIATSGPLFGRDEDVAALVRILADATLVTLVGPGGVGKSRLAEAAAAKAGEQFDDGATWCSLAAVSDTGTVTAALLATLRVQHRGGHSPREALLTALGTRQLLLVLDTCEHLLDAVAEVVMEVRRRCPNVTVLATSREHLHLPGERIWEVTPLPVPGSEAEGTEVADTPAGALFRARARAVQSSFALTDANASTVGALCRRLDGIPLAIELAASRLRALSLDDVADRIDQRFELLTGGSHRDAGRHRTLQATVAWSHKLLTEAETCLFDRLSVFAGPFELAAAEEVCGTDPLSRRETAGVLAELVDKSLVAVDRSHGLVRYRLLDTLRAYGARQLEQTGAIEHTRRSHATYHVRLAEELGAQVRGPNERAALERLDGSLDDMRAAQDWLVANGKVDGALRLPAALHDDLLFSPRHEVFAWVERALELANAREQPAFPAALVTAALGAMNHGDLERARGLAEESLSTVESPGGLVALRAQWVLGAIGLYAGQLDDLVATTGERLAPDDTVEHGDYQRTLAHAGRALVRVYSGDGDAAARAAADARAAAGASGNHTARAWALYNSGEALLETDPEQAAAWLEQAIDAARQVDRRFIEGVALVSLASLCGRRGETHRALALFRDTIAHWRPLGAWTVQLTTLRNLVELLVHLKADEAAAQLYGAVTAGMTPSYGAEAERLGSAWRQLEERLGPDRAVAAAERGRGMTEAEMVDEALATLDRLLDDRLATRPGRFG